MSKPKKYTASDTKGKFSRLAEWQPVIEVVVIILLCLSVGTAAYQAYETRRANKIASDALVGSQRPWVGLVEGGLQTGPLSIRFDYAIVAGNCSVTAKNYGSYPAENVFGNCELVIAQDIPSVQKREREVCKEGVPEKFGYVLFPGSDPVSWSWPTIVRNEEVKNKDPKNDKYLAFIVGSIHYTDQFHTRHCTSFSYRRQTLGTIAAEAFTLDRGQEIPGEWVKSGGAVDPQ